MSSSSRLSPLNVPGPCAKAIRAGFPPLLATLFFILPPGGLLGLQSEIPTADNRPAPLMPHASCTVGQKPDSHKSGIEPTTLSLKRKSDSSTAVSLGRENYKKAAGPRGTSL